MEAFKGFLLQCQEFLVAFGHTFWGWFSDPWITGGVATILLVSLLVFFLSKKQPSRIRAFTNGSGYVEISRTALVEIIRSKSEQIDIEKKPGVVIRSRRGKLHVDIKIRLLPSRRLTEVSDILQQHLREALQEGLGIRKLGNINVMVTGVRVKTGKAARKSLPLNPDVQEPERKKKPDPKRESESATFEVVDDEKQNDKAAEETHKKTEPAFEQPMDESDSPKSETNMTSDDSKPNFEENPDKREIGHL